VQDPRVIMLLQYFTTPLKNRHDKSCDLSKSNASQAKLLAGLLLYTHLGSRFRRNLWAGR
jgi:hypothetical protein